METRNALIVGAGGMVGTELLHSLLDEQMYDTILLYARKEVMIVHPKVQQQMIDFSRISTTEPQIPVTDVYCTLGTTIKTAGSQEAFRKVDFEYVVELGKLAEKIGAQQYLVVSAMGADSQSGIFYNRVKGEMEDALEKLNIPSVSIFNPSLLLGKRKEFRFGERLAQSFMGTLKFLFIGGLKQYRAIHARQVAHAMIRVAQQGRKGFSRVDNREMIEMKPLEIKI